MNDSIFTLRQHALKLFQTGINAADPYQSVKNCLTVAENHFEISLDLNDKTKKRFGRWTNIRLIAFGKAACNMIKAAVEIIPEHRLIDKPIAITNYENVINLNNIDVIGAGHPLPDISGMKAAALITEKLKKTGKGELVFMLISGGGSALMVSPASGITLEDKVATTDLLLSCGANIRQINCVRKHLSLTKGGRLALQAVPADLHAFVLSDVLGDNLSTIASGPTVPDESTYTEAINILIEMDIWHKTAKNVRLLLKKGALGEIKETPKPYESFFKNTSYTLVCSNTISLNAVVSKAQALGYKIDVFSHSLCGEAKQMAEQMVQYAKIQINKGLKQSIAILAGGETTVTLNKNASKIGKGGRNQEMALAFAIAAKKHQLNGKWVFLSGGTDGRDGPTDAAGGLVDSETVSRLKKAKTNPQLRLDNNDSYSALKISQDLVITGATGTNVADLQILLIQPE